jgi:lipoprotein-releasing system ATP-binding protein
MTPALELRHVARSYAEGAGRLDIFKDLSIEVYAGEIVALVGQSGAGKSSLLHIAGLLEAPTSGEVFISGQNCTALDDAARTRIRRIGIGFVYQFHHLLPEFSALENVVMPQLIAGAKKPAAVERAMDLLDRLGLAERFEHRPSEMSGGEQQRVAIARAFVNRPMILIADEPTGNLDPNTSIGIMKLLDRINRTGTTVVMATHDAGIVDQMRKRVIELSNGAVVRDQSRGVYGYQH